jgi:hypothetical protein
MTTTPPPRNVRFFQQLLQPSAEKIEWFISQGGGTKKWKKHFTTRGELDRFKATLIRAKIAINDVAEEQTYRWLLKALSARDFYHRFRLGGKLAVPSKELRELNAALGKWLRSPNCSPEKMLLHFMFNERGVPLKKPKSKTFVEPIAEQLFNASTELIDQLEATNKKTRFMSAATKLQLDLYYLYVEITGKDGLSDGGPAHRFVKTFAAEIDESVDVPEKGWADLIRKARNRKSAGS